MSSPSSRCCATSSSTLPAASASSSTTSCPSCARRCRGCAAPIPSSPPWSAASTKCEVGSYTTREHYKVDVSLSDCDSYGFLMLQGLRTLNVLFIFSIHFFKQIFPNLKKKKIIRNFVFSEFLYFQNFFQTNLFLNFIQENSSDFIIRFYFQKMLFSQNFIFITSEVYES